MVINDLMNYIKGNVRNGWQILKFPRIQFDN